MTGMECYLQLSYVKLWDTETGQVVSRFCGGPGRLVNCVKFNPNPDWQRGFLAGYSDKRCLQWDTQTGKIIQNYWQHYGGVQAITFHRDGSYFMTASDDKSLRTWAWGIPVVVKLIAEPHMHSMPRLEADPTGDYTIAQSLDNQILVYNPNDRWRQVKKKRFAGHTCAGYPIGLSFSDDSQYVVSGDAEGKLWFWDYKTCKNFRTLRAHSGVIMDVGWHPIEPSWVMSAGSDGLIKLWD